MFFINYARVFAFSKNKKKPIKCAIVFALREYKKMEDFFL